MMVLRWMGAAKIFILLFLNKSKSQREKLKKGCGWLARDLRCPLKAVTPNQRNHEKVIARVLVNRANKVKGPQERFDKSL